MRPRRTQRVGSRAARRSIGRRTRPYSGRPTSPPSAVSTARQRLKISRAGPMQANTRSAPRTPSPCRRAIHSAIRRGSSLSTSAHSPTGASSGRGRQTRWTLVARAAESRARRRDPISVAIGQEPVMVQPPRIMPESRASQSSVVLWANTTDPIPSSARTRRPSAKAFAMVSSNHSRSLGRPSLSFPFRYSSFRRFPFLIVLDRLEDW